MDSSDQKTVRQAGQEGIPYTGMEALAALVEELKGNYAQKTDMAEYSVIRQETPEAGFSATYRLTKDGSPVGVPVNIPQDRFLKTIGIREAAQDDDPVEGCKAGDKYLDLFVAVAGDHAAGTVDSQDGMAEDPDIVAGGGTVEDPDTAAGDGTARAAETPDGGGNETAETTDEAGTGTHLYILLKDMLKPYVKGHGIEISSANEISVKVNEASANGLFAGPDGMGLALASAESAGAMSAEDKEKLDGLIFREITKEEVAAMFAPGAGGGQQET